MKPNQYEIAALIGKFLRNQLTEEEERALQQWLDESETNRGVLESFRQAHQLKEDLEIIHGADVPAAWLRLKRRRQRSVLKHILRYAGYAAVLSLFIAAWIRYAPSDRPEPSKTEAGNILYNDVMPGGNKAQLILSDGRAVQLQERADGLQEQDGTEIVNKNGALTYAADDEGAAAALYNTVVIPRGGTYQLTLSDGTKVWLNAMSEMRFPVRFGDTERVVELKGEAYFEVARDAKKPFRVQVGGAQIEVLGTHFNVNSYGSVTATLLEGAVAISNGKEKQLLEPGQEAQVGERIILREANIAKAVAWKNGDFYFKSDRIDEIMEQLSRWYGIEVQFAGEIPGERFNGNIQRAVNLSEVLEMLSYVSGSTFEVDGLRVKVKPGRPPVQ
jgi:Fe2+-dicitrate sensor, membrane component